MGSVVYFLCALTSIACAVLLLRGYQRSKVPLLFWSALCFSFLALNNILLVIDLVLTSVEVDLSLLRTITALIGLLLLNYGLVGEVK